MTSRVALPTTETFGSSMGCRLSGMSISSAGDLVIWLAGQLIDQIRK
jgi:hypothetical protein